MTWLGGRKTKGNSFADSERRKGGEHDFRRSEERVKMSHQNKDGPRAKLGLWQMCLFSSLPYATPNATVSFYYKLYSRLGFYPYFFTQTRGQ